MAYSFVAGAVNSGTSNNGAVRGAASTKVTALGEHTLTIEGKQRVVATAVAEVVSATDRAVYIKLADGSLQLTGEGLKVEKLSPEEHLLVVSGSLSGAIYGGGAQKSLLKRIFK